MNKSIDVGINLELLGVEEGDTLPGLFAYAFDKNGKFIGRQELDGGKGQLQLPVEMQGKSVRVLIAPELEKEPEFSALKRLGAYETRFNLRERLHLPLALSPLDWRRLLLCICYITGRVVKSVRMPDGTVKYLPICHARVTICEVDRFPLIIKALPDDLIWRLRDNLLRAPEFPPEPPEEIIGPLGPLNLFNSLTVDAKPVSAIRSASFALNSAKVAGDVHECESCQKSEVISTAKETAALRATEAAVFSPLKSIASVAHLRATLIELMPSLLPRLCLIDWLEPYFLHHKHCFRTVMTDDDGRFHALMRYPCNDIPDLYFSVDQWSGSSWNSIYKPSLRCGTHWNYRCGTEVTLVVTDSSAVACSPADPVDAPDGVGTWVMPYMVGAMPIFGDPGAGVAPDGWVKPSGYVDYSAGSLGTLSDAPFGGTLGFRLGYSQNIPMAGLKYYRFSYRKVGALDWSQMSAVVSRHYVHEVPGQLPSFPVYPLGPHTLNSEANLFEFKPDNPPAAAPGDPAETITYWPEDDWFGDIYSAFLDTNALPGGVLAAAGQYEIKVEVFDSAANQVPVGSIFSFIVPQTVTASGATARLATAGELDANGFVFRLRIDNNPSTAIIDAPAISSVSVTDSCGFLRYTNPLNPVTLAFHARHPNNQAVFGFGVIRGTAGVAAASVSGYPQVGTTPASAYVGDAVGNYAQNFPAATLLGGCDNAAYAITLGVYGKATNGWGRIGYDAGETRAFALAQMP